jgi:CRP-like cAMP-binding protein
MNYEPRIALEFFSHFGKSESFKLSEVIFMQGQKANRSLLQDDKMYLVVKGKVSIQLAAKHIATVKNLGIFGELTPLIMSGRSASAVAQTPCRLLSLSDKQLVAGLKEKPEFALMLMNVLVNYLRMAASIAKTSSLFIENKTSAKMAKIDPKMCAQLMKQLGDDAVISVPKQQVIFQEGETGTLMYLIMQGFVTVRIGDKIVERSGQGDIIGEIALVDQKQRLASVITDSDCLLLAISRQVFLDLIKTQPEFAIALLRALASRLYLCRTGKPYMPGNLLFSGY